MEVTCEHCNTKLNIPDEKIPKGQVVKFTCPKCKEKISLDTRQEATEKPSPAETGELQPDSVASKGAAEKEEGGYGYQDYSDDKALDFFEEGTKLALVMEGDDGRAQKVKRAVEELGYQYVPTSSTRDATGKLRFHHFDLIIISDGFDGQQLEQSPILNYLNRMGMTVRRRIFVALLGDKFKTKDDMMTFAMSANVVINNKDMDRMGAILKKAITENEKFYKVYTDLLVETGKA
jgi:predicted Zn finger-like uncharacterized protein